jgi:hypothetical protein
MSHFTYDPPKASQITCYEAKSAAISVCREALRLSVGDEVEVHEARCEIGAGTMYERDAGCVGGVKVLDGVELPESVQFMLGLKRCEEGSKGKREQGDNEKDVYEV